MFDTLIYLMAALASVWLGLTSLLIAATMVFYRPAFTDVTVTLVVYFGTPGALCLAGMVLWAHRKDCSEDPAIAAQRFQAKVAIVLSLIAAGLVYGLVGGATTIEA